MRKTCPLCRSERRISDWTMEFVVPDGWTLPEKNIICLCLDCGLIYYDNDRTQTDYDIYYRDRYGFDGAQTSQANFERLDELVTIVLNINPDKETIIVDFGGGEGYITKKLSENGFKNAITVNVGENLPKNIGLLIASHVIEHLYDLKGIISKIINSMSINGQFLIEVPDAQAYAEVNHLPILDYHQKHAEHFAPSQLDYLFFSFGYNRIASWNKIMTYDMSPIYRAIYAPKIPEQMYYKSKAHIMHAVNERVEKLRMVNGPVIVWGCGDICLHMLTKVKLNIIHYVDLDPAFRGATIKGIPVLDHVEANCPILIIAKGQKDSILKSIKDAGLNNEVIEV